MKYRISPCFFVSFSFLTMNNNKITFITIMKIEINNAMLNLMLIAEYIANGTQTKDSKMVNAINFNHALLIGFI